MPKIKINDIHMYYESHGQGQPVVFITGFTRDHSSWQNVMDVFAKKYQVIIFDNRGAGQSDCPDFPYTVSMMAGDTISLCKELGINSAYFISNSMGGMILQDIAYRHPEFVKCAVIGNSAMKTDIKYAIFAKGKYGLMKSGAPAKELIEISLPWAFSSEFLNNSTIIDTLVKMGLEYPYQISLNGYHHQLCALLEFDSRAWISKINVPCLVIGSDQDYIFAEKGQREMGYLIPNALYHCFFNVGHAPHIEVPKAYVELVLGYLSNHS